MMPEEKRVKRREQGRERSRVWRAANPEKVRERKRADWEANREKRLEKYRAWAEANPEKVRSAREECKDSYIALLLGLPVSKVPRDLLEAKREQVLTHRCIKQLEKAIKEKKDER